MYLGGMDERGRGSGAGAKSYERRHGRVGGHTGARAADVGLLPTLLANVQDRSLGDAAVDFGNSGFGVFPCSAAGKRPVTPRGFLDASTDEATIRGWWTRWPTANIGLATGMDGVDVVDVDVRPAGSGWAALARADDAGLTDGWLCSVQTPSGGRHLYFPARPDRQQRSWANTTVHLDFRGTGGYVLVPPSRTTATGEARTYELLETRQGASPIDGRALAALLKPSSPRRRAQGEMRQMRGRRDLDRLATWVAARPEGARNSGLFWAACRASEGLIDPVETLHILGGAAVDAGLGLQEVTATIRSAYRTAQPQANPSRPAPRPEQGRTL